MIDEITKRPILVPVIWNGYSVDMLTACCAKLTKDKNDHFKLDTDAQLYDQPHLKHRRNTIDNFIEKYYPNFRNSPFNDKYRVYCEANIKHYKSTRYKFIEQVKNLERFRIITLFIMFFMALASLHIIGSELLYTFTILALYPIMICICSWIWPVHFFDQSDLYRDDHDQLITNDATLIASTVWENTKKSSPVREGNIPSFTHLREVIADVLISSPYSNQHLLCEDSDIEILEPTLKSHVLQIITTEPIELIKNITPWPLIIPKITLRTVLSVMGMQFINPEIDQIKPSQVNSDKLDQLESGHPIQVTAAASHQHHDQSLRV